VAFAVFAFLASFVIGPVVQANSMAEGMHLGFGIDPLYSGIALIVFTALVIPGGFTSIHAAASFLIPFISIVYIMASLIVLALHAAYIPVAIGQAVKYAFSDPMAIPGALAGWSVKMAITKGISRGLFSNEAGLGSAQKVHATANVDHPVRQGLYGIFEVFVDTMIICSMTALVILTTQSLTGEFGRELSGAQLTLFAFEAGLGSFGRYILAVGFPLFAYTTILGWYAYGRTAAVYLFGVEFKPVMKILWMLMILFGAAGADFFGAEPNAFLHSIWDLADTLNAFMAIPNLIGLLLLSGVIRRLVKDFDEKRKSGEIKI
jgi:AGCS family alanine or glycine:cation symporter